MPVAIPLTWSNHDEHDPWPAGSHATHLAAALISYSCILHDLPRSFRRQA